MLVKVSRREKDEIDFVIDAMRIFVARVRAASRPLLALGVLLILLGVSLAGWPQAALGQDRSGYWYVAAVDHGSLARYTIDGDYPDFAPGDTFLLQGNIESIEYYAPLEESGWPLLVPARLPLHRGFARNLRRLHRPVETGLGNDAAPAARHRAAQGGTAAVARHLGLPRRDAAL